MRHRAGVGAKVCIVQVAIVASFIAGGFGILNIGAPDAISTLRHRARIGAGIEIDGVAIVAGFIPSLNTVTTCSFCAVVVTPITVYGIAIVAGLESLLDAIAALGIDAETPITLEQGLAYLRQQQ